MNNFGPYINGGGGGGGSVELGTSWTYCSVQTKQGIIVFVWVEGGISTFCFMGEGMCRILRGNRCTVGVGAGGETTASFYTYYVLHLRCT